MTRRGKMASGVLAILLQLCVAACSDPMLTTQVWQSAGPATPIQGLPYFLPIGAIPITLTAQPTADTGTAGNRTVDGASIGNHGTTAQTTKPSSPPKDNSTGATPTAPAVLLSLTMDTATTNVAKPAYSLTISAGAAKFMADNAQEYYLGFDMPSGVDSTLTLKVDGNGLLSDSSAESVDETAAEAAAVTQTIAAVAKTFALASELVGTASPLTRQPPAKPMCDLPTVTRATNLVPLGPALLPAVDKTPQPWTSGSDPAFPYETDSVVSDGLPNGESIKVRVVAQPYAAIFQAPTASTQTFGGPLFRDWARWRLTLIATPNSAAETNCNVLPTTTAIDVMLPNGGQVFTLNTTRAPLVDKTVTFTVSSGMLNGLSVKRPSPLLAGLKLPLTVLQPILSLPFSAITGGATKSDTASGSQ